MQFLSAILDYNQRSEVIILNKTTFLDELFIEFKQKEHPQGHRYTMVIHIKNPIVLKDVRLEFTQEYSSSSRIFCNGFQSSSASREYVPNSLQKGLSSISKSIVGCVGDYRLIDYPNKKGHFHSWTYSYIKNNKSIFMASVGERTAYTSFHHDIEKQICTIRKDINGMQLSHSFTLLDIVVSEGSLSKQYDHWLDALNSPVKAAPKFIGQEISFNKQPNQDTFVEHLETLQNVVQEDSQQTGLVLLSDWQQQVTNWELPKTSLPADLPLLTAQIHQHQLKAGIKLAPFLVHKSSSTFKQHKNWLVKNSDGKLARVYCGGHYNKWFYVLDFHQQDVKGYLQKVLFTISKKWAFDIIHLQHLFAASIFPLPNKTRAQIMQEVLEFITRSLEDKLLIVDDLPIGAALGHANYIQFQQLQAKSWKASLVKQLGLQEYQNIQDTNLIAALDRRRAGIVSTSSEGIISTVD